MIDKQEEIPFWQYDKASQNWCPADSTAFTGELPATLTLSAYNILFHLPKTAIKPENLQKIQNQREFNRQEQQQIQKTLAIANPDEQIYRWWQLPIAISEKLAITIYLVMPQQPQWLVALLAGVCPQDALAGFTRLFLYQLKHNWQIRKPEFSQAIGKLWRQCLTAELWTKKEALSVFRDHQIAHYVQAFTLDHQQRMVRQIQLLQQNPSDIYILCEVTGEQLAALMADHHIRDRYLLSHAIFSSAQKQNFWNRNILLYRRQLPWQRLYEINIDDRLFYVRLKLVENLNIFAIHTTAYDNRTEERKEQIRRTLSYGRQAIIAGDLNIHNEVDEKNLQQLALNDGSDWLENAITFDGLNNSLIRYIYLNCEARQMKLDRILFADDIPYTLRSMQIIAKEEYCYGGIKAQLSDHYGLKAVFVKK